MLQHTIIARLTKLPQFYPKKLHYRIVTLNAQIAVKDTYIHVKLHRVPFFMLVVVLAFFYERSITYHICRALVIHQSSKLWELQDF